MAPRQFRRGGARQQGRPARPRLTSPLTQTLRDRVARWLAAVRVHTAIGPMFRVAGITLGVRVFTFVREMLMARSFGVGDLTDAFVIAYLFPALFINVLAASLNVSLIPVFMSVRRDGGEAPAQRLLSNVTALTVVLLVGISVALAAGFPGLLALLKGSVSPEKAGLTYRVFLLVLPTITLGGLSTIWAAILNAEGRFNLAAATPALSPLIASAALLAGGEAYGIYALAGGLLLGQTTETILLGAALRRSGFSPLPWWTGLDASTRRVLTQYVPMVAGASLMSGTGFVDQSMAATLATGSVAALSLGNRVPTLLTMLGSTAVGTVALPHFSALWSQKDLAGLRASVASYLRLILLVSIPLTVVVLLAATPIVRLLFQRGAFTSSDSQLVGRVLAMYALQIPFYIGGVLLMRVLSAIGKNEQLLGLAALNFVNNLVLNVVLMRRLEVAGLALSTSLVIAIWFACCWVVVRRRLNALASGA